MIVNNCLATDKSNEIVDSKVLITKAADAITIIGKLNTMLSATGLKPTTS